MLDNTEPGKRSLRLKRLFRHNELQTCHPDRKATVAPLAISAPIIHPSSSLYYLVSPTEKQFNKTANGDWQGYPTALLSPKQPMPLNSVPPRPRAAGDKPSEPQTQGGKQGRTLRPRMRAKSISAAVASQPKSASHDPTPAHPEPLPKRTPERVPDQKTSDKSHSESRFLRSARDRRTVTAEKASHKEVPEKSSSGDLRSKPRRHSYTSPDTPSPLPKTNLSSKAAGSPAAHAVANMPPHQEPLLLKASKSTPLRIKTYNVRNQHESPQRQRQLALERRRKQIELEQLIAGDRRGSTVKLTLTPRKVLA